MVTAFHLAQWELRRWAGCDGFFNSCLLRTAPAGLSSERWVVDARWTDRHFDDAPAGAGFEAAIFSRNQAAWDDNGAIAEEIRDSLRKAAGIEYPASGS